MRFVSINRRSSTSGDVWRKWGVVAYGVSKWGCPESFCLSLLRHTENQATISIIRHGTRWFLGLTHIRAYLLMARLTESLPKSSLRVLSANATIFSQATPS